LTGGDNVKQDLLTFQPFIPLHKCALKCEAYCWCTAPIGSPCGMDGNIAAPLAIPGHRAPIPRAVTPKQQIHLYFPPLAREYCWGRGGGGRGKKRRHRIHGLLQTEGISKQTEELSDLLLLTLGPSAGVRPHPRGAVRPQEGPPSRGRLHGHVDLPQGGAPERRAGRLRVLNGLLGQILRGAAGGLPGAGFRLLCRFLRGLR